jgi:hypothetical protein
MGQETRGQNRWADDALANDRDVDLLRICAQDHPVYKREGNDCASEEYNEEKLFGVHRIAPGLNLAWKYLAIAT